MIPIVSKILSGDKAKAAHFLGLAQRQLNILLRQMELSTPKPLSEGERTLDLGYGAYITVSACYNARAMRIHIPVPEGKQEERKEEFGEECFSVPHFALGVITAVDPETPTLEQLRSIRFLYDMEICAGDLYIIVENVTDANFGRYYISQRVIVTIGPAESDWDKINDLDRRNLLDAEMFSSMAVIPIHISNMDLWQKYKKYNV
jgi:hypothetical protein